MAVVPVGVGLGPARGVRVERPVAPVDHVGRDRVLARVGDRPEGQGVGRPLGRRRGAGQGDGRGHVVDRHRPAGGGREGEPAGHQVHRDRVRGVAVRVSVGPGVGGRAVRLPRVGVGLAVAPVDRVPAHRDAGRGHWADRELVRRPLVDRRRPGRGRRGASPVTPMSNGTGSRRPPSLSVTSTVAWYVPARDKRVGPPGSDGPGERLLGGRAGAVAPVTFTIQSLSRATSVNDPRANVLATAVVAAWSAGPATAGATLPTVTSNDLVADSPAPLVTLTVTL